MNMRSLKVLGCLISISSSITIFAYDDATMGTVSSGQNRNGQAAQQNQQTDNQNNAGNGTTRPAGLNDTQKCINEIETFNKTVQAAQTANQPVPKTKPDAVLRCENLIKIGESELVVIDQKDFAQKSVDGKIMCNKKAIYTIDYKPCLTALSYYNAVINAEGIMDLQQKVRTDVKNQNIQKEASQKVVAGDTQTATFDAAIESNKHQKNMQQEKMAAYGMAVGALIQAYRMIPGEDEAKKKCLTNTEGKAQCEMTLKQYVGGILGNQDAKTSLATAIATFTAKALQAGIAMGQYNNAAKQVEAAKKTVANEGDDLMVDRCAFNPADPACVAVTPGSNNGSISPGSFQMDPTVGNNSFNLTPDTETTTDPLTDPTKDENAPVASVNSPFVDEAERARDIINPAGAAQMQAGTDPSGGSPGGGGAPGGGSAQVGNDLNGADKDGNKEASIKPNEVSGTYAQGGGGGYKALARGKDDANPFSSLFDAKSDGGIEEDRSIASEDIDGASSGLFQKISRRYGQVQADKRIEAKNLE